MLSAMFGEAVIEHNVDDRRQVERVMGGNIDHVTAPAEDGVADVAILWAEDVKGTLGMLIVGQWYGVLTPFDGYRNAIEGNYLVQIVNLE